MRNQCGNEKCSYRLMNGNCSIALAKDEDIDCEIFYDANVCGWIDKLGERIS